MVSPRPWKENSYAAGSSGVSLFALRVGMNQLTLCVCMCVCVRACLAGEGGEEPIYPSHPI